MVAGSLLRYVPLPYPRTRTLSHYFGKRFLTTAILVFVGILSLVALVDYIEMMRKTSGLPNVPASIVAQTSLFRVPQIAERIMPFSVLIAAMSCYLNLSRRPSRGSRAPASGLAILAPASESVVLCSQPSSTTRWRPPCRSARAGSRSSFSAAPRTPACRTPATASGCARRMPTASRS
jgi:lipopolysaccharide export system permease protein